MLMRIVTAFGIFLAFLGAARASPPLEAYGRLPGVELMRLSPSGERYATLPVRHFQDCACAPFLLCSRPLMRTRQFC